MNVKTLSLKVKLSFCRFFIYRDGAGTNCEVSKEVGLALCEAFEQADKVSQKFFMYFFAHRFPLFFVRNPKVNVKEEPWVKLNTV